MKRARGGETADAEASAPAPSVPQGRAGSNPAPGRHELPMSLNLTTRCPSPSIAARSEASRLSCMRVPGNCVLLISVLKVSISACYLFSCLRERELQQTSFIVGF
jgi:hypothetical protein